MAVFGATRPLMGRSPTRPARLRLKRRRGRNISQLERQGGRFDTRQGLLDARQDWGGPPMPSMHLQVHRILRRKEITMTEAASVRAPQPLAHARQAAAGKIAG
jgi:hypothetical protein